MASVLLDRLESIRRRHSRLVWLRGASVTLSLFLGMAILFGGLDWWVHVDDAGLRGLLGTCVLALAGWSAWRWWWRPACAPPGPLDVALRLERRCPGLRDRLASGVEFATTEYASGQGSPALQKMLAEGLEREIDAVPWDDALDTSPVQRWAMVAVATCLVAAGCLFVNQGASWLAVRRLFAPFGAPAWPRAVNLRVMTERWTELERDPVETPRVPLGDEFRVYFENRTGRLPDRVFVESESGGKIVRDPLRVMTVRDETGTAREVAVATLAISGPVVRFRGLAGDDTEMPFFEVRGIPAPRVESLAIRIFPPTYLSLAPRDLPEGLGDIEAWVGSRVEVRGRSNRPLQGADARLRESTRHAATVDPDGKGFRVDFTVTEPGVSTWWLDLVDVEGLRSNQPPKFELRAVPDMAPEVTLEQPASDAQVTATAKLAVRSMVKDDLGVGRIDLVATITGAAARTERVPLWRREKIEPTPPANEETQPEETQPGESPGVMVRNGGQTVPVVRELDLGEWRLAEGDTISLYVEAGDIADPEHVGRSSSRLLKVVSGGEKVLELAAKQAEILEELDRARALEQTTRDQTRELATQALEAGGLRADDVESLKRLEHAQRQVTERLSKGTGSIRERVAESLAEFAANGLDTPESTRSLRAMADELSRLADATLPRLEEQLTRARKAAESSPSVQKDGTVEDAGKGSTSQKPNAVDDSSAPGEKQPDAKQSDPKQDATTPSESTRKAPPGKTPPATEGELAGTLRDAALAQDDVVESLSRLTSDLTKLRNRRDTAEQVAQVAAEQRELNERSAAATRETLGKSEDDLTPQQRAEAAKLAERQQRLADKLDGIQSRMEKLVAGDMDEGTRSKTNATEGRASDNPESTKPSGDKSADGDKSPDDAKTPEAPGKKDGTEKPGGSEKPETKGADESSTPASQVPRESKPPSESMESGETETGDESEMQEALRQLRESSASGKMRDAAAQLQRNQSAAAARNQREAAQELAELERNLRSPPTPELDELVKRERELEDELDNLLEQQAELMRKVDEARKIEDESQRAEQLRKLDAEREKLRGDAERIARGLERLRKRGLAEDVRDAAEKLRQAQQGKAQGDEGADDEAAEAVEQLEQAREELAEDRAVDEEQLAFEQLEKIRSALEALAGRQAAAALEFDRLAELRKPDGSWTRAQLLTLRSLASTEAAIGAEATALGAKIAEAKGYSLALEQTGLALRGVAEKLAARDAGEPTRRLVHRVAARLTELVTLLAERQKAAGGGAGDAQKSKDKPAAEQQAGRPPSDGIPLLAELKLVRAMQRELLERTTELSEASSTRELTASETEELARLRDQQEQVADLGRQLISNVGRLLKPDDEGNAVDEMDTAPPSGQPPSRRDEPPSDDPSGIPAADDDSSEKSSDESRKKPAPKDELPTLDEALREADSPRKGTAP
jgi:hypothetical protein